MNERIIALSERIGEVRSSLVEHERRSSDLEARMKKAIELINQLKPEELLREFSKSDAKIEAVKARINSIEAVSDRIIEEMKEIAGPNGTYTDPRVIEFLKLYKELYDKGYFMEGGMNINYTSGYTSQIVGNRAAILLNGCMYAYTVLKKAQGLENSGMAPFPVWGKGKLKDAIPVMAQVQVIAPWTKHPEAAVTVLKELLSAKYQNKALEMAGVTPVNPNWDRSLVKDPNIKLIYDRMTKKSVSNFYPLYDYPVWQAQIRYITLYLLGEISAEEAMKKMDEAKKE